MCLGSVTLTFYTKTQSELADQNLRCGRPIVITRVTSVQTSGSVTCIKAGVYLSFEVVLSVRLCFPLAGGFAVKFQSLERKL